MWINSALKCVETYLHSTMKDNRLNHFVTLHFHKMRTDILDMTAIGKIFISNRPFPKLSINWIRGIFAFSKIWLYKLIWNVMKNKSWKFCSNSTFRSKVIVLLFLVKLLSYYALRYPASFSCKHAFSMLILDVLLTERWFTF